jgi:hypothetical protein
MRHWKKKSRVEIEGRARGESGNRFFGGNYKEFRKFREFR